jgi:DNA modification methylase
MTRVEIITGDCLAVLKTLDGGIAQTCVTSPPYFGLRDYGVAGQIGLEDTPDAYVARLVEVFREVRRVLRQDGTLWLNLGDSYSGSGKGGNPGNSLHIKQKTNAGSLSVRAIKRDSMKRKDLIGIPWRVALALQADGWYLRQDIIWHKPNPMPESVTDRCTKAHEYVFLLSKSPRYFFDADAISEPAVEPGGNGNKKPYQVSGQRRGDNANLGQNVHKIGPRDTRNRRSVWTIATKAFSEAHFATFPPELPKICIKAGSRPGDMVLDPFGGAGTSGLVADRLGRRAILIELNREYAAMASQRIYGDAPLFAEEMA